jgi:CubicO group peptidase (beta-lactamase class C family)
VVALGFLTAAAAHAGLPETPPERLGFDPSKLARIDAAIERAIAEKKVPGAVALVARHGKIAHVKAYGRRAVEPAPEPMTTATSTLILMERGRLNPGDSLAQHLPDFDNHGKGAIRVEQLLRHRSGLIADNPLSDYSGTIPENWRRLT